MHSQQNNTSQIKFIVDKINNKNFAEADRQLNAFINASPQNAELWHLKSITTHALGKLDTCEIALKRTLALSPNHVHALMNLAKLQQSNNWFIDAISTYKKLLKIAPNTLPALFNIGVLLNQQNEYPQAELFLQTAYKLNEKDPNIQLALGQSLLNQDNNSDALSLFNRILASNSNHLAALNNKGIALKKLCYWNEAIECLQKALTINPNQIEIIKNLASCYTLIGDFPKSKNLYKKAISINNMDKDAHHWLNQQLWENKDPEFLDSYKEAIKANPQATELLSDMGHKQNLSSNFEEAKSTLEQAIRTNKKHVPSLIELGVVLRELNQLEESQEIILQAYKLDNNNLRAKEELGKSYISCDAPQKALNIFNELLLKKGVTQQGWLAYKAIALKLLKSSEYDYLCNYDHVLITDIDPPKGYDSLQAFNQSLVVALREYHFAKTNPLDQSLISGSQTSEKLFDYHVPIIQELRQCFRDKTLDFLHQLPKDENHPLLSKNTGDFIETDSWSVILHNTGFHKNHHHPAGWYSGPYYAQIPEIVKNSPEKQGWVKFGQPGFNMMTQLEPDLIVEPTEGMMVRFPSYFWHGTIPFVSPQERITVPGDIIPI